MLNPFILASILGFKHALDPDHLAAVFNMALAGKLRPRQAAKLGLSWGVGHASSMALLGLPVVLFSANFPEQFYLMAELGVGLVILWLTLQLFLQWFKGEFHPHTVHNLVDNPSHHKAHKKAGVVGFLHGLGGSGPAALLVMASFSSVTSAAIGLIAFILLSIVSMVLVTVGFAAVVTHHRLMHFVDRVLLPTFIVFSTWFGYHYVLEPLNSLNLW